MTLPLVPAVVEALREAVDEMGTAAGLPRLRAPTRATTSCSTRSSSTTIARAASRSTPDEIFVSDGSKQDSGNIQEIFGQDCRIAVTDPVYPVYVDTNVMAGRTGAADAQGRYAGIIYLRRRPRRTASCRGPPAQRVDLAYLCSPNNPTGAVATPRAARGAGWRGRARATRC